MVLQEKPCFKEFRRNCLHPNPRIPKPCSIGKQNKRFSWWADSWTAAKSLCLQRHSLWFERVSIRISVKHIIFLCERSFIGWFKNRNKYITMTRKIGCRSPGLSPHSCHTTKRYCVTPYKGLWTILNETQALDIIRVQPTQTRVQLSKHSKPWVHQGKWGFNHKQNSWVLTEPTKKTLLIYIHVWSFQ
jgi:hypothetical protein